MEDRPVRLSQASGGHVCIKPLEGTQIPSGHWAAWSGQWKVKVKAAQSCPTLCDHMDLTVHAILQARIPEWVAFPFSRGSSQSRDQTQVPTLQVDSLPAKPQGKPKNTGVCGLSLLQGISWPRDWTRGLLCCGWILYRLSYQVNSLKQMWTQVAVISFSEGLDKAGWLADWELETHQGSVKCNFWRWA